MEEVAAPVWVILPDPVKSRSPPERVTPWEAPKLVAPTPPPKVVVPVPVKETVPVAVILEALISPSTTRDPRLALPWTERRELGVVVFPTPREPEKVEEACEVTFSLPEITAPEERVRDPEERLAEETPPAKEEVAAEFTSSFPPMEAAPEVKRFVEERRVEDKFGMVEVAEEVWVIFPPWIVSPETFRPTVFNWEAFTPPSKVEVPAKEEESLPERVSWELLIRVPERFGRVEVAPEVEVSLPEMRASEVRANDPPPILAEERLPAKVLVPAKEESNLEERLRVEALKAVPERFGIVEVPAEVDVILPEERRSPVRFNPPAFN
jgi:hypothetical protein